MAYGGTDPGVPTTSFGDIDIAEPTPKVQLQFVYGVNPSETTIVTTGTGTVTSNSPYAVVQSSASTNSSAILFSKDIVPYREGQGGLYFFTALFRTGVAGNVQMGGCGGTVNGLFFGYNGTVFGINRRSNGIDNWVVQNSWNGDPMNGTGISRMTLNPLFGNVYKIQMSWLGFGAINFFIENPTTGNFVKVHTIRYPNSGTVTSILQPSAPLLLSSTNTTNNTNISIQCPSMAGFVEGLDNQIGNVFSFSIANTILVALTEGNLLGLRNNATFQGILNYKTIKVINLSLRNVSQFCNVFLRLNATLSGSVVYNNIDSTQSCASVTGALVSVTGGTVTAVYTTFIPSGRFMQVDLSPYNIYLYPGDSLTLSIAPQGANSSNIGSLSWIEMY